LTGIPSGGRFTGKIMEGNPTYFVPSHSKEGKYEIVYQVPYKCKIVTTTDTITIRSYDFEIKGLQSVCSNSVSADSINPINSEFNYIWEITGGAPDSKNNTAVNIKWDNKPGVGIAKVIASHKNSTYKVEKFLSVFKTVNQAYDVPALFFGDKENRLAISSFTSAFKYRWIPDGQNTKETKSHFYYFSSPVKSKVQLELETEKGCKSVATLMIASKSISGSNVKAEMQASAVGISSGSLIYPNPARDQIWISPGKDIGEPVSLMVYDARSLLVYSRSLNGVNKTDGIKMELSGLESGIYYAVVKGSQKSVSEKFVVTK
jgi:hypothetical protein